jgi:predicted acylesterase/phospholipase RssA
VTRIIFFFPFASIALATFQVGAYKEFATACQRVGCRIDWVAGVSIGAINATVIASILRSRRAC